MRRGKQVTVEQRCYVKGAPNSLQVDIELRRVRWNKYIKEGPESDRRENERRGRRPGAANVR